MKKALVTGITGQDGSYLAELLLDKGYEVHGIIRRIATEDSNERISRIEHIRNQLILHSGDIQNGSCIFEIIDKVQPDECYHLAAQSFVHESFNDEETIIKTNITGAKNVLFALRKKAPKCKFYFAGSSEMFGKVKEAPQTENTPFHPRSPYGISKVYGFHTTRLYREAYGIFACSGILFNHESPRRGFEFVTRKISRAVARIKKGQKNVLALGNLNAKRDWGFSGDYVKAMWLMLQQDVPDDYVIATGENHSIKEFIDLAFSSVNLPYSIVDLHQLSNEAADAKIKELCKQKEIFVVQHPRFYRPAEVDELLGDTTKAKNKLGWEPKMTFKELVNIMVKNDLKRLNVQ